MIETGSSIRRTLKCTFNTPIIGLLLKYIIINCYANQKEISGTLLAYDHYILMHRQHVRQQHVTLPTPQALVSLIITLLPF